MESNRAEGDALRALLDPASIAIVGASESPDKVGGRPLHYLSRFAYGGRVYPVNPNRETVQGVPAYRDLASLPEAPDLAVIAVPGEAAVRAVDDCAARGVGAAIVMASGFGETFDEDWIGAERAMVERARSAGMRIVGPNSQGLANFGTGAVASFSTMFLEVEPADGPVGIVSQSGVMSVLPYGLLRGRGIGVRHVHATGNEADLGLPELALAVARDPEVELLLLYIESIRDAETLALAAETARARGLPIVALKSGRSASGKQAARSHTGALANDDRVVDAFFRKHGIWRAQDVQELVGAAELYLGGWRPERSAMVVMSNSGASCVMAADASQGIGLELPALSSETTTRLRDALPSFATTKNPIDVTGVLLNDSSLFGQVLTVLADEPAADLLMVALPVSGAGYDVEGFAHAAADYLRRTGRPVVVVSPQAPVAAAFRSAGVPTFDDQTRALSALSQLAGHARLLRESPPPPRAPTEMSVPPGDSRFLSEAVGLEVLGNLGLPTVWFRLCGSEEEAVAAFHEADGPIVLKASSEAVPHKSEHGLVLVGVDDEPGVRAGFRDLMAKLTAMDVATDGVIAARLERGRRELVLGARTDPIFGAVVMVGDGGKYVEALGDVTVLLPPFGVEEVRRALYRLRIAPLLDGVRGEPPLDVAAFCEAAVRLGDAMLAAGDDVASIDLNPVMTREEGGGVVIVDALVERGATRRGGV